MDRLLHYGVKRKSGRYPWGSGEDPYQSGGFLNKYDKLKEQGLSEKEIASKLKMNTTELRNNITWANQERRRYLMDQVTTLHEAGMSNVMIGKKLGISEGSVRDYLKKQSSSEAIEKVQLEQIEKALKAGVEKTGYLDVGVGVEHQLGVSRTKFNAAVNKLINDEGYNVKYVFAERLSDPTGSKKTTIKVLTKETDQLTVTKNSHLIRPLDSWSDDAGLTIHNLRPPIHIDFNRIKVRYAEEGGADKDGLIELRRGAKDLDLGASKYAQVRIAAGENSYLKGMAAYGKDKDFPDGVDIIFNTNKAAGTPKEKVFKEMKDDADNPFGTTIKPGGQKGALNIVNEQGDWDIWSTKLSSQFLSKQPLNLIKERLDATQAALKKEFDEINALTNPVVKKHLMDKYVEGLDSKAKHLKAQGLPRTKNHVLMPVPDMKPNEVYATQFKDGERVVLVRHPHGGKFEIPELVVNNKHKTSKDMLGDSPDAIGIHPSVASKLSGADFDGDTVLVIPNNNGMIKTSRSLKELTNWGDEMHVKYKRDHETISSDMKQTQMGIVSNLITDMTIKGASDSELARAVKHSMVVIDAEKHKLDYKQSAIDNGISALKKKYQSHINPDTGKASQGASTLISRSKQKIDISQPQKVIDLSKDKVSPTGTVLKKGLTAPEIAKKLNISESTVKDYLSGGQFDPHKYSSNYPQDKLYANYVQGIQSIKNTAMKTSQSIKNTPYSKEAAKLYSKEVKSLNEKLTEALLNAPKERQAQLLTNHLYYTNVTKDMDRDSQEKLKSRSLARARVTVGAKKKYVVVEPNEWEAIQSGAISTTKLKQILDNADMDTIRKLATPKQTGMSSSKASRAKAMLSNGYTYSQIAESLGVSTSAIRDAIK